MRQAEIPAHTINEQVRFNRAELLEWATARRLQVSPDLFQEPSAPGRGALPTLVQALEDGGVAYGVEGRDQTTVLQAVVNLLKLPPSVDRAFLFEVLQAREGLGSTGVGNGIAVPHVRNPVVLQVARPTVTLCFLKNPIDFHALDGRPVRILFVMISSTVKVHLHLLSRLGFVLRNPDFNAALQRQAPAGELRAALEAAEKAIRSTV